MSGRSSAIPSGSRVALVVLLALVMASPWPFGSAHPLARWLITLVCLVSSGGIAILRAWRKEGVEVPLPAALAAGVFLFGVVQLVPIPADFHWWLAPGSASIWHPTVRSAAAVLGDLARPISIWPEATRRAAGAGIGMIALATLVMPALRDRRWALRSAVVVVASGVMVAVYALIARLFFGDKLYGVYTVPTIAPFGPFVSKNHFAGYVEMAALLGLGLAVGLADEARRGPGFLGWVESRRAARVVAAYGAFSLLCVSVLVSLSRGGAVSLGSGLLAFVALHASRGVRSGSLRRYVAGGVAIAAVTAALAVVLPTEARERLSSIGLGGREQSTSFRLGVWRDSLRLASTSPLLGQGLGAFEDAFPRFNSVRGDVRIEHAESDYLEILAEAGAVGLALVLGCLYLLARAAGQATRGAPSALQRGLAVGGAAGVAAMSVHSLFDFNLRVPSGALLCLLLAASFLSAAPARTWRLLAPTMAVLCVVMLLLTLSPPHRGRPWQGGLSLLQAAGNVSPLRLRSEAADLANYLNERPADGEAWVWLAWVRRADGLSEEGSTLASYGASLEPARRGLRDAAERLQR